VRLRDQRDDRKSEPAPACGARFVRAAEAVEGALEEAGRETWPCVGDVQLDDVISLRGEEVDCPRTVRKRVVDEIRKGLFDPRRIGGDGYICPACLQLLSPLARPPREAFRDCRQKLVDTHGFGVDRQCPLIGSCDQQQILCELGQTVRLLCSRAHCIVELVMSARPAERELEFCA
jgi:hypothetical protein